MKKKKKKEQCRCPFYILTSQLVSPASYKAILAGPIYVEL